MSDEKMKKDRAETDSIFAQLSSPSNSTLVAQVSEITARTQAIAELAEMTSQFETPYIGNYLSA